MSAVRFAPRASGNRPGYSHRQNHDRSLLCFGLAAHASLADIKKAFRQKASFYHPDKNDAPDAAQRFAAVQKAYEVLRTRPLAKPMTITADATCWTTLCRPPRKSGKPTPTTFLPRENFSFFP